MKQVVVLGIGNRLMGDDGIGVRVAESLNQENKSKNIRFAAGETDVYYCLSELEDADLCIIIDGACTGGNSYTDGKAIYCDKPGTIRTYDLRDIFEQMRFAPSFHDFDLFHGMISENMIREGILITIEISSAELSTELSKLLSEQYEEIVQEVKKVIRCYTAEIN